METAISDDTQTNQFHYRRTPLPADAQFKLGWIVLWLTLLLASPFIGFAVDGKVGEAGLLTGLGISVLPITGLALLAIRHWMAMRRLPHEIAVEWQTGRVIPPDGAPAITAPVEFTKNADSIALRVDGILLSKRALLGFRHMPDGGAQMRISQTIGEFFVPWADLREWEVCDDSDGPNYYRLPLRTTGCVLVRRFAAVEGSEAQLLDAVRAIGKLPVRMLCDIDDDQ